MSVDAPQLIQNATRLLCTAAPELLHGRARDDAREAAAALLRVRATLAPTSEAAQDCAAIVVALDLLPRLTVYGATVQLADAIGRLAQLRRHFNMADL